MHHWDVRSLRDVIRVRTPVITLLYISTPRTGAAGVRAGMAFVPVFLMNSSFRGDDSKLPTSRQLGKEGMHLLVHVGRQVAHVEVGGEGIAVVEAAVALRVLPAGALLAAQPLPLLARLLLPVYRQPPRDARQVRAGPSVPPPPGPPLDCC